MINGDNIIPDSCRPDHPPGVICVASGELSRYPSFADSMIQLLRPRGTHVMWNCGLNVAANFNLAIRSMLANPLYQWAWIMGDDHEFDPTTLLRLLDREQDILVPLVVRRQPPFIPVLFKEEQPDTPYGQFPPHWWHEIPAHGLHEVHVAGSAGMLIRRNVLESMEDPWFEAGRMGRDLTNEDTWFCKKAQQLGFRIFADCDVQMYHWTPMALVPLRTPKGWTVGIKIGNDLTVSLPHAILEVWGGHIKEETKETFAARQAAIQP